MRWSANACGRDGFRKMSQTTFGKALGVTFQQFQKPENGVNRFGSGRMSRIAEVVECDATELFDGVNDARRSPARLLKVHGHKRWDRSPGPRLCENARMLDYDRGSHLVDSEVP